MKKKLIVKLNQIGGYVRETRRSQMLSQTQVAEISGVSLNFVSQLESGKSTVRLDKVLAVMDALGLQLEVIYKNRQLTGKGS